VGGTFLIFLPRRLPDPDPFGDELLDVLLRQGAEILALGRQGKGLSLGVLGARVHLHGATSEGSDVAYGRSAPDVDDFPDQVRSILDAKAPKLRRYKAEGFETWIVAYNTVWTVMTPVQAQQIVASQLGPEHEHVDHVG